MKFSSAKKQPVGRGLTRERQRRDRASTPTLRASYPGFEWLRVELEFRDTGAFSPVPQTTVFHPPASAYFVFPCPYQDCDGEIDLSSAVQELSRDGDTHRVGRCRCTGQRAGEAGRSACQLTLEYSLEVQRV